MRAMYIAVERDGLRAAGAAGVCAQLGGAARHVLEPELVDQADQPRARPGRIVGGDRDPVRPAGAERAVRGHADERAVDVDPRGRAVERARDVTPLVGRDVRAGVDRDALEIPVVLQEEAVLAVVVDDSGPRTAGRELARPDP